LSQTFGKDDLFLDKAVLRKVERARKARERQSMEDDSDDDELADHTTQTPRRKAPSGKGKQKAEDIDDEDSE
jgi:hypothetical protein